MLPHVLEIYAIWHPDDANGAEVGKQFLAHFHGSLYGGLIGGAVEVYERSAGWMHAKDSPRPIPFPRRPWCGGVEPSRFVAVVPVLGTHLARAVSDPTGPWTTYLRDIREAEASNPSQIRVFPLYLKVTGSALAALRDLFPERQPIAAPDPNTPSEPESELRCRDLAQALAQWIGGPASQRIQVFISHTKRARDEHESVGTLIKAVRGVIGSTRLKAFFDANDLQSGRNWDDELRNQAGSSALLAIRTDLYATREWCQREVLIAKTHGMPVVMLDALSHGESRGSFLMDHVPRIPVKISGNDWNVSEIRRGLNLLVDECLKRTLWQQQQAMAHERPALGIDWWAPHAPEPTTLVEWLSNEHARAFKDASPVAGLRILHPDPPLGPDEQKVLGKIARSPQVPAALDLITPRMLAARGGCADQAADGLLPVEALRGQCVGISVSDSPDLARLGLTETHFRLALAEIARCVLVSGGSLAYGGHLKPDGYTVFLVGELEKYGRPDRPMLVCLAWNEHRKLTLPELQTADEVLGVHSRLVCLDPEGKEVSMDYDRGDASEPDDDAELRARSLTGLRNFMSQKTGARVLLGGKRNAYQGRMPGLLEEAMLSIACEQPLYLAGGFGGITLDIAQRLDARCADFCPPRPDEPGPDHRAIEALRRFEALINGSGWAALHNGLTFDENLKLAATHRPGEIAELVCLGLGRSQQYRSRQP